MTKRPSVGRVLQFRPHPGELERLVRSLAMDSNNVRWRTSLYESHAEYRSKGRDITDKMMFEVLRTGYLKGDIEPGKYAGEWKVKMCKEMKGRREIGVVALVINQQKLFVKTVEWEDVR